VYIGWTGIKITAGKRKYLFLSVEITGTYIKISMLKCDKYEFVSYFKDDN